MEKYQTKLVVVEAFQYDHTKKLPPMLMRYEGIGGYQGRIAYYKNPRGDLEPVRPTDWVVSDNGTVKIMSDEDFLSTYELTKQPRGAKKSSSVSDNAKLKAPESA